MSRRAPILASVAVALSLLGSCGDSGTQEAAAKAAEIEAKVNAALLAKDEADKKAEAAAGLDTVTTAVKRIKVLLNGKDCSPRLHQVDCRDYSSGEPDEYEFLKLGREEDDPNRLIVNPAGPDEFRITTTEAGECKFGSASEWLPAGDAACKELRAEVNGVLDSVKLIKIWQIKSIIAQVQAAIREAIRADQGDYVATPIICKLDRNLITCAGIEGTGRVVLPKVDVSYSDDTDEFWVSGEDASGARTDIMIHPAFKGDNLEVECSLYEYGHKGLPIPAEDCTDIRVQAVKVWSWTANIPLGEYWKWGAKSE